MSDPGADLVIELRKPYAALGLGVALFVGGGCMMVDQAVTNDRGLVIDGIITLETGGADVFYAIMGALSLAMGALSLVAFVGLGLRREFRVVVGASAISVPYAQAWRKGDVQVAYETILGVDTHPAGKPSFVRIQTTAGPRYVSSRYLPKTWPASAVAKEVVDRWRAWRATQASRLDS